MGRTRVLWLMVGFSILLVRTSEGRAADSNKSKGTTSSTTPSSLTSYSSTADQMTSDTSTPTTTSTIASTTSTASTPTMSTPASNYTSTENITSSSTPPPYVDQYGNNLPKVVNASTQYYNETTDIMEALPLVPLEDNGGGNAFNGNQAWIIYRIPEGAPNQPMAMQPNQMQNYVSPQIEDLGDTYTCSNPQPESQMQQPPGAIRVVLQPVQAFQADYYKVDDSSSSASAPMMKPLNDFFYR